MSTNAYIAYEHDDGQFEYIYVHGDGYPEHTGRLLREHYYTREDVRNLMSLGDLSFLDRSIECPMNHSWANPVRGYTVAYGRDRGEKNCQSAFDELSDIIKDMHYVYVLRASGHWETYVNGQLS